MEYKETIKEAEKLARILIQKKARKSIGIYYFIWGFYELYITLAFTILYSLNVTNVAIDYLLYFAVTIPLYYTFKLFRDINWEYIVFKYKTKDLEKVKKQFNIENAINAILILVAILVFLIIIPHITTNEIIALGSVYVFIGLVMYSLYISIYSKYRIVEPRYYDLLAMISFPFMAPVMAGLLSFLVSFLIAMLVAMAWLYAGFRSILEVSEIE